MCPITFSAWVCVRSSVSHIINGSLRLAFVHARWMTEPMCRMCGLALTESQSETTMGEWSRGSHTLFFFICHMENTHALTLVHSHTQAYAYRTDRRRVCCKTAHIHRRWNLAIWNLVWSVCVCMYAPHKQRRGTHEPASWRQCEINTLMRLLSFTSFWIDYS